MLNPEAINVPIVPSGDLAIIPPSPESAPASFPPMFVNGFRNKVTSLEPAPVTTPASFPASPLNPADSVPAMELTKPDILETMTFPDKTFPTAVTTPFIAPPTFLKYVSIPLPTVRSFVPSPTLVAAAAAVFPLKSASIFCTVFTPLCISRNPSFPTSPAVLNSIKEPTTFVMVFTSSGFSLAKSAIFVMISVSFSAASPTTGRNTSPSVMTRFCIAFFASCTLFSVVSALAAYSPCILPAYREASPTFLNCSSKYGRFVSNGAIAATASSPK